MVDKTVGGYRRPFGTRGYRGDAMTDLGQTELEQVAARSWLFGYPLVLMDTTRRVMTGHGQAMNAFDHMRSFPDHTFTDVVSPNADTLFSVAWLDLRAEPIVLSIPEMAGRFHMMPMSSGWTDVFFSPGTRTTGERGGDFVIVGPDWSGPVPSGVTRVDAPTNMVFLVGRTGTAGTKDFLSVHRLQDQYLLTPLSRFEPDAPSPRSIEPWPSTQDFSAPADQVARMDGPTFFGRLARLLADNPPQAADGPAMDDLSRLGIAPSTSDEPVTASDPAVAAAIAAGPSAGQALLRQAGGPTEADKVNGWVTRRGLGNFGSDYAKRADAALTGLGANLDADSVYARAGVDSEGRPLGGHHRYRMHFPPGELPPVRGFWSLTLYNDKQFFVDNPIDRYAIGDRDDIAPGPDGSVDILIQHDEPDEGLESNWLPAPTGSFNVILRAYWPEQSILNGAWTAPPLVRVD